MQLEESNNDKCVATSTPEPCQTPSPKSAPVLDQELSALKRRHKRLEKRLKMADDFKKRHEQFIRATKLLHIKKDRAIRGLEKTLNSILRATV